MGRIFLYTMVVYLYSQVFCSVKADPNRLWYISVTEWIILSTSSVSFQIAQDVKDGRIVYFLLRPIHYILFCFIESFSVSIMRYTILGFCCLGVTFFLTSNFPTNIISFLIGSFFVLLSIILYTSITILIDICSFWIGDIKDVFYLNLTAGFFFGGLIVPIDFYPSFLRSFCFYTPYPWIIWGPAEYITEGDIDFMQFILGWGKWMLILSFLISIVHCKFIKSFMARG